MSKSVLVIGNGYIGSYLAIAIRKAGHKVSILDHATGHSTRADVITKPYQSLSRDELAQYDSIMWFAGHSSVPLSIGDPVGAVRNNATDLFELLLKKPAETKLIYASSASVYSGSTQGLKSSEDEPIANSVNVYDASKIAFDAMTAHVGENVTGLRMGTVSGWSPRLRSELIFNAMNLSAMTSGTVRIANAEASRSILFLEDLTDFILKAIWLPDLPKVINCGSYNISIGDLGMQIAEFHNARIERLPNSETYSFRLDFNLFKSYVGSKSEISIADRCKDFIQKVSQNG